MKGKENQRIKLTRQLLSGALIEILQKKPIHTISIRELCERAGINRTTFYNHYGSQYELLEEVSQSFLDDIAGHLATVDTENRDSVQERVTMVLTYLSDNLKLSRLLLNNNVDPHFAERIFALPKIGDLFKASLRDHPDPDKKAAIITFAIHGSYRLLQEWVNRDERLPASEEAVIILELARKVCS